MCTQVAAELQGGRAAGVGWFTVEVEATFCMYASAGCMLTATLAGMLVMVAYRQVRLRLRWCKLHVG